MPAVPPLGPGDGPESSSWITTFENSSAGPATDTGVTAALTSRLSELLGQLVVSEAPDEESRPLTLILVGGPTWEKDDDGARDHLLSALDFVTDCSKAIIRATGALVLPTTRSRLHPWIAVVDEVAPDVFESVGVLPAPTGHTEVEAVSNEEVTTYMATELHGDFTSRYFDLQAAARRAFHADGDWAQTVLLSATASEFLIKHVSWVLEWDARTSRPTEAAYPLNKLFGDHPGNLVAGVLSPRLTGSWDSSTCARPVGAWRKHTARKRSDLLHRGTPPSENDAFLALEGERKLSEHVLTRLGTRASDWPRAASVLALAAVDTGRSRPDDLAQYLAWLDQVDPLPAGQV